MAAVAAVAHALVVSLAERHAAGEELPVHDDVRILENRWRALRHGVHGRLVDLDTGEETPTRDLLRALIDELGATAAWLGCQTELDHARTLLAGNGADRQRAIHARHGLTGLAGWIADETEAVEPALESLPAR
jgi:carboxylate-amine ligase